MYVSFGAMKNILKLTAYTSLISLFLYVCTNASRGLYTRTSLKNKTKSLVSLYKVHVFPDRIFFDFLNCFQSDINYTCIYFHISMYVRNSVKKNIIQVPSVIKINYL